MAQLTDSDLAFDQSLRFDNRFTRELPSDPETDNRRRQVNGACYSRVRPKTFSTPKLVAYSSEVADLLGLSPDFCTSEQFVQTFVGNRLHPGMDPYATCYGGHQFGNWAGQLGDGRAINLGEIVNADGQRWALQLKGAGATPYARMADGLAVLRSSIREFLCSEAMHHLGVPTTRALSVITTGEAVERDMFYDGNAQDEPGAVVCRVAPSFTRFGSFEICTARGDTELLRQLVDYTIQTDFPELPGSGAAAVGRETYIQWFDEVCRRTALMIAHWQRVGFVHGVMNTDNMSVLGLTIDYGPYGWLEDYDPNWTPNTTDASGRRYRFGHQPQVGLWNLAQLANALYPLIEDVKPLQDSLDNYCNGFDENWRSMRAQKLGFPSYDSQLDGLFRELDAILALVETDMTIFYRQLAAFAPGGSAPDPVADAVTALRDAFYSPDQLNNAYQARLTDWLRSYSACLDQFGVKDTDRRTRMDAVNPKYVLRNYMAQLAIDRAEQGDNSMVVELLDLVRRPYAEQPNRLEYAKKRPDWARNRAGCSMLSCSS